MSLPMLERAARELEPFLDEVAFVGGATIALWITDPGAPAPRATKDVDVVVEVASRLAWHNFEERIRAHGLRHDTSGEPLRIEGGCITCGGVRLDPVDLHRLLR